VRGFPLFALVALLGRAAAGGESPDSAAELSRLGQARLQLDEFAGAEEALARAVALGREDPATRLALAAARWENGHVAEAEVAYRRALEVTHRAPAVLHPLGRLLVWSGRPEEAVALLGEARAAAGDDALLLVDLARALDAAGRAGEAIAAYRTALELAPEHAEARYRLGFLLARAGETVAAQRELARYRELEEAQQANLRAVGLETARLERARAELAAGRPQAALALLATLSETADVLLVVAQAHLAAGEPGSAVDALQRAVTLAPQREDLLRHLTAARLAAEAS
jgi:Flp pilus assembly protein TadD